jgi:S-DNA-T family DNA segregation ATPase FtsK/SpoIIIE
VAHTVQVARGRRWRAAPGPADLRTARIDAEAAADDEDTYLRARLPGPADVRRIAQEPRAELWSRRGWLEVRLGVADRPASVRVDGPLPVGWEHPVLRRAPVAVDLAALGGLGIAGPWPWVVQRLAWVLAQSAVLHAPDELPIVVLAPDADEDDLGWVRWLPHVRAVAWDPGDVAAAVRAIPTGPALVVLAGVADPALAGALPGRRLVCTADDPARLPATCRAVLTPTGDDAGAALRVDGGPPVRLEPDTLPAGAADAIARRLAPLRTAPAGPAAAHRLCAAPVSWADPGAG